MSKSERCGVFYEEAESPEADLVQDELFGVAQ